MIFVCNIVLNSEDQIDEVHEQDTQSSLYSLKLLEKDISIIISCLNNLW